MRANPAVVKEAKRRLIDAHQDEYGSLVGALSIEWTERRKDADRAYRATNKAQRNAYSRDYYQRVTKPKRARDVEGLRQRAQEARAALEQAEDDLMAAGVAAAIAAGILAKGQLIPPSLKERLLLGLPPFEATNDKSPAPEGTGPAGASQPS